MSLGVTGRVDRADYFAFGGKSRMDQAVNSLLGIVEGISLDGVVNPVELGFLNTWLAEHHQLAGRHPYSELMPVVQEAIADGVLTEDERQDIRWLCERLRSTQYYDEITADLQRLHALVGGVAADGSITVNELRGLSDWLVDHDHLQRCWPYDEVGSLVTTVLADGIVSPDEHKMLQGFFSEFTAVLDDRTITSPKVLAEGKIAGLCAVCPDITFQNATFCFTGASTRYTRAKFSEVIRAAGGNPIDAVRQDLDYLVIGADGNPCWAYACYGRKVEKAVEMRKQGCRLLIVHENDVHDELRNIHIP